MGFEDVLLDFQTLAGDQQDSLRKAFECLEKGDEEAAIKILQDALEFAAWDTAYINDLPDSSFAVISPGGKKDEGGKTVPRGLRHLPYKSKDGKVDLPHLRNALARLPQTQISGELKAKARSKLESAARAAGVGAPAEKAASELFGESGWLTGIELAGFGKEIQIIKTGEFQHPVHGRIRITESDLKEMVANFNNQIRGQQIPVDVDHKHELGAVGWFKSIRGPERANGDFALFASIDWTDKGKDLVKGGAFKYFSPHFGDWVDPEKDKKYQNVLLSGAITNFPFLKGMQPVSFNEFKEGSVSDEKYVTEETFNSFKGEITGSLEKLSGSLTTLTEKLNEDEVKGKLVEKVEGSSELSDDEKKALVEEIKASKLSDDEKKSLVEKVEKPEEGLTNDKGLSELRHEFEGRETNLQKQLGEANDRIKLIEREKRAVKFMEIVAGSNGKAPWVGSKDKHLLLMETLADQHGEDSDAFKNYVEIQESHAEQIKKSGLFNENGTSEGGPSSADEEIDTGVKKLMEEDKDLTLAEATTKWLGDHQDFYAKYDKSQKKKAAEAGG